MNQQADIQHSMALPAANAFRAHASGPLVEADPDVACHVLREHERQRHSIELIASENFVSRAVLEMQGAVLTGIKRPSGSSLAYVCFGCRGFDQFNLIHEYPLGWFYQRSGIRGLAGQQSKAAIAIWEARSIRTCKSHLASKHMQFMIRLIIKNAVFLI